jgi:flavin-dependent dehydrogenase
MRHYVRWLVDQAGIRELFPSVCLDARQPDDEAVRAQCTGAVERRRRYAHPNRFFISSYLAHNHLAPKPNRTFPFDVWYGYHFDAVLLGEYLHKKAVQRGVKYTKCHVTGVQLNERGEIASVSIQDGEPVTADIFVDCTGFAGILIQKALDTPFVSFSNNLFNDSAIAMPTPIGARAILSFPGIAIMSGMGIFPDQKDLRVATAPENRYSMEEIDNLLQRSAQNFKSQRDVLMKIPKKVEERSLQIYFW